MAKVAVGLATVLVCAVVAPLTAIFMDVRWIPEKLRVHAAASETCCAGNGLSVFLAASLAVCVVSVALHDVVLPGVYPDWEGLGQNDAFAVAVKRRKIVVMIVALLMRGVCLAGMVSVWGLLDWEHGLVFNAVTENSTCDITAGDVHAVRAFYLVRVWLAALMVWELGYLSGLHWDDYLHHILVMVFCSVSTDPAFGGGEFTPLMQACAMSLTLGASIAALNYAFLLAYNMTHGRPAAQAVLIFTSAIFSWVWQLLCFVYVPLRLTWGRPLTSETVLSVFSAVSLFAIDSKANVTRVMMARAKWAKSEKPKIE